MSKIYKNIVIGGGASGLMFCANLKSKKDTLLIEHNSKLGAKILISGGGRCNYTNIKVNAGDFLAKKKFVKSILHSFSNSYIDEYFKKRGLQSIVKNGRELFCKNSSKEILDILLKEIKGIEVALNCKVLNVTKDRYFEVVTTKGNFKTKNLIIATGGLSFPKLGATSIGYDIAKHFGHNIISLSPALVGFTLQPKEKFFKELSGVSVDVNIKVAKKKFNGSLLFAHKGLSGPAILNASLFWKRGEIEIDFLPNFEIESILNSNKSVSNLLPLPKRVALTFLNSFNIIDKRTNSLTYDEIIRLKKIKSYKFAPAGTFGYSKAEVTRGGIDTDEISSETLESKLVNNLYFLGEVLDVTGRLGGFNFTFAFASALKCARSGKF